MDIQQRFKEIPLQSALNKELLKQMGLKFGLVYYLDEVLLNEVDKINEIDQERLIEARFFNEEKEIHIFHRDGLKAVLFEDESTDLEGLKKPIKEEYFIVPNDTQKRIGKKIHVKNYILFDIDGQAYIGYTRPCYVSV